jgi:hypothetical protein
MGKKNFILISLSLLLVLESVVLIFLAKKVGKSKPNEPKMAVLSLEPAQGSFKVGEEFEVKIILDTGDWETDATDVRLRFPSQILSVGKITEGKIYDDYPAKRIDLENGVIIINGITSLTKTFGGKDVFAIITFKGIKPGPANLIFEFAPSSTTDSNVVATGIAKDVLGEVEGASIEISK